METARPAGTASVAGWIQELPSKFQDAKGGFMAELMWLALDYFDQVKLAAENDMEATPVKAILYQYRRLNLLKVGDGDLDQRLYNNPKVRKLVVSSLLTVVLVLNTGVSLLRPEDRKTLIKKTHRILEQASAMAHHHLVRGPSCAPVNVVDFCNSAKDKIRSSLDDVYVILPATHNLVPESPKSERRQSREIGYHGCGPRLDSRITRGPQRLGRKPRSKVTPSNSSIFHGTENSCRSNSDSSKPSEKTSCNSTKSPSVGPLFSDTPTHHNTYPSTVTVTPHSPSEVGISSDMATSNSTQTSLSCKKCSTTFSDLATLETHPCRTNFITRIRSKIRSRTSKGPSRKIEPIQFVTIWHRDGQTLSKKRLMSLDSATHRNLILRSIVEKLDFEVTPSAKKIAMEGLGDGYVELSELVQPKWQFEEGRIPHQDVNFHVVPNIPGEFDMLLGSITCARLGINLGLSDGYALVAQSSKHDDQSTLDQQQQQYGRQHSDGTADEAKIRQQVVARHRKQLRQREVENAANKTKSQAPTSQENATRSGDKHG